jgi:dTDP-4-dehydrorhamnose 3,5-epimerase-like enzyme
MEPRIIKGSHCSDHRGYLTFNNDFCAFGIKRIYTIQNESINFIRAWQGHQIEQRWFSAVSGSFQIKLIKIDDWQKPSPNLPVLEFSLTSENLDILHIPAGFVTSIQALEDHAKLLLFADYNLHELQDEYRFAEEYFK